MKLESKLADLLPDFTSAEVIAYELTHDGNGWSVNQPWCMARNADKEDAIMHLANRFEVFVENYDSDATVDDIEDDGDDQTIYLNVNGIPFAELRIR